MSMNLSGSKSLCALCTSRINDVGIAKIVFYLNGRANESHLILFPAKSRRRWLQLTRHQEVLLLSCRAYWYGVEDMPYRSFSLGPDPPIAFLFSLWFTLLHVSVIRTQSPGKPFSNNF